MDKKGIYKRLKNGKGIETTYRFNNDLEYDIRIDPKGAKYQLHTFHFEGNDVFKDENYKDEKIRLFEDFELLIKTIQMEFPGIEINI